MGFLSSMSRAFNTVKFGAINHSPELLMGVGTISMGLSIFSAIGNAMKFDAQLKKHNERLEKLDAIQIAQNEGTATEEMQAINVKQARMSTYIDTAKCAIVTFAPTIGFAAISICSFFGAAGIMKGRYATLASAFAGLASKEKFLESRIVEEYGEDKLRELKMEKASNVINAHVDEETGEVIEERKEPPVVHSMFSKWFDEGNEHWTKSAENNRYFLDQKEQWANRMLETRGYLFLNEVYEMLGMEKTQAGAIFGWLDKGEQYQVNFGIFNADYAPKRDFVNGTERSILLEFNVEDTPIIGRCGFQAS